MMAEKVALGKYVDEVRERLGSNKKTIYSVTNQRGFIPALETFGKQVFSEDTSKYKVVRQDDLAFNPSRINVGSVALCPDANGGAVSPMYTIVRCCEGLLPEYLLYFLRSPIGLAEINHRTEGAVRFQLKFADLQRIPIYLPSIPEQQRIVRILDEADELRRLRAQADRRTADLISAIFAEMFGDSAINFHNWETATVSQLLSQKEGAIRTGPFGSDLLHSEFINEGIPVLGIDNVVTNAFRWTEPRCIPFDKYKELKRFRVYPEDVLITIMGTVGRSCVAPSDLPECISTKHLCVLTVDRTKIEPAYLQGAFLYDKGVRHQTKQVGSGAIMEGWNSQIIRKLEVHVPPLALQREFVARATGVRQLEESQEASRNKLDALFDSLLHRAFKGEL